MIDYIRIQNFKSITDATFHLQDVNLLVGANNSGKTNFLKALQFLSDLYNQKPIDNSILNNFKDFDGNNEMSFTIVKNVKNDENIFYKICLTYSEYEIQYIECIGKSNLSALEISSFKLQDLDSLEYSTEYYCLNIKNNKNRSFRILSMNRNFYVNFNINIENNFLSFEYIKIDNNGRKKFNKMNFFDYPLSYLKNQYNNYLLEYYYTLKIESIFSNIKIYKPNLPLIAKESPLSTFEIINEDSSNLVSFIDEIMSNNPIIYDKLNLQISTCVQEFSKVTSPNFKDKVSGKVSGKKLNFISKNGSNFSANNVSDGVLYFLSLLCIINQPNSPKLLILEEPENGIHPVRIQEIINYIFELAESQKIQIILTSHSPVVIDLFTDYPENIFVFNKENDTTEVKNLKTDIIDLYTVKFGDKVNILKDLSSNWFAGLIGGVPL